MNKKKPSFCIAILGNALLDSRVLNMRDSLRDEGCRVQIIAFDWMSDITTNSDDDIHLFKLKKSRFPLVYYISFFTKLFSFLMKTNADTIMAEDIVTLPVAVIAGKIRKKRIIFTSREIYTKLAGLHNKRLIQFIISLVESLFIKQADLVVTTGELDSEYLVKLYGLKNTLVQRNLPKYRIDFQPVNLYDKFKIPRGNKILIYQGVILEGRGLPHIISAMDFLAGFSLVIAGGGMMSERYKNIAAKGKSADRIIFTGPVEYKKLLNYTASADLGICLIENISFSYYYALPNKMFEYMMTGTPALISNMPQMKKIVETYKTGVVTEMNSPEETAEEIKKIFASEMMFKQYKANCFNAARELNWENEFALNKKEFLG